MRSHGLIAGVIDADAVQEELHLSPQEYCHKNFNKAYAHLFRAGYDAYDVIGIRLLDDINHILKRTSQQALYAVIPDASEKIVVPHHAGEDLLSKAKAQKDVCNREAEEKQFLIYEEAIDHLQDVRGLLEKKSKELIKYDREQALKDHKNILIGVLFLIIGFLLPDSLKGKIYTFFKPSSP